MSPKPKVQLLLASPSLLAPGDHATGALIVDVVEETFELTGIYVELVGKEVSYVKLQKTDYANGLNNFGAGGGRFGVGSGAYPQTQYFHFTHVQIHHTMYGASKESGRRGGAMLAPGHYEYPFDMQVPYAAPPSYTELVPDGGSHVYYNVRGVVSVPYRKSIRQRLKLTVLPVVSFEQAQFTRQYTLTPPAVEVPLMKFLGLSESKTQFVKLQLQLCPSAVVLGGSVAAEYYAQQRQVSQGGGTLVMGRALGEEKGSSSDDDDADDVVKKEATPKKGEYAHDGDSADGGATDKDSKDNKNEALPGKLVRLYKNNEDSDFPFKSTTDAPGVLCARLVIENHTHKESAKTFEVALRQVRSVNVRGFTKTDVVSLSKLTVELPHEQAFKPGERVAVDVELPIRRDLVYCDKTFSSFFHSYRSMRRKTCPTVTTPAFTCENVLEVTFPKISLKKEMERFPACVQLAEIVGVPRAPYVPLPTAFKTSLAAQDVGPR